MKIDFANLNHQYRLYQKEIDAAVAGVLENSQFIMGPQVAELETSLAEFTGAGHCIACSSGTDALQLALMALDVLPGGDIITTPFTFIATAEMIAHLGARPVFVDIEEDTYNIDAGRIAAAVTDRTRAIMPVSLFGQPADMDEIKAVAAQHNLPVIEDAAQSFGASYKGRQSCNLSELGCTSFFPAKPLGCYGDGGAVFCGDSGLAEKIRSLRVHGQGERYRHKYIGIGGRLDTIQAAVLLAKLEHYDDEIKARWLAADRYTELLRDLVVTPTVRDDRTSVWAQYSIRLPEREKVREKLTAAGVPTAVHYPMPLHLQECFSYLGLGEGDFPVAEKVSAEIMSLPMNAFLTAAEQEYVAEKLREVV